VEMMTSEKTKRYSFKMFDNEILDNVLDEYVVIDIETTGIGEKHRIVELAGVKFRGDKVVDVFDTYVDPGMPIPAYATAVHGIRDADVAEAPTIKEIMPYFCKFIGNSNIVGHNVRSDLDFLLRNGLSLNLQERYIFDTLALSRKYVLDTPNHKLETMIRWFNINTDKRHRAKDDSIATGELFIKLYDIARKTF
jgi:DNA polymerase III epsilon subunit family exonuclease